MKNRWLFRRSCGLLVEKHLEWMLEKYFKKNAEWTTRKDDLENWKTAMRFVSRKHMDLFGYYFPPEIVNWFCDDWINEIYRGIQHFYPLNQHVCLNVGGEPRYAINNQQYQSQLEFNNKVSLMRTHCANIVKRDLERITSRI